MATDKDGKVVDIKGGGEPRDETGEWKKDKETDAEKAEEQGGPVGISVKTELPGIVRVNFDRAINTIALNPIEALMFCQALLQSTIMSAKPSPQGGDNNKSRIILPS